MIMPAERNGQMFTNQLAEFINSQDEEGIPYLPPAKKENINLDILDAMLTILTALRKGL